MTFKHVARRIDPNLKFLCFDIQSYGLCNQLFSLACAVADGSTIKIPVKFRGIYPDMISSQCVSIETFLDIEETNKNLQPFNTKILTMEKGDRIHRANIFALNDKQKELQQQCLKALVFSQHIRQFAVQCAPKESFYCVHFRLDVDMILFYRAGPKIYHQWINLTDLRHEKEARNIVVEQIAKNREWIRERIQLYVAAIFEKCSVLDAPIYVLTAIGKPTVHLGQNDLVEWAFREFESAVAPHCLVRCAQEQNTFGREYAAAVELCVACLPHSLGFIGSSGSTFSETIRIRNPPEKLLSVVH